jgi:hypothetical protein
VGQPGTTARLWPEADKPVVYVTTIGGQPVPADPWPNQLPLSDVQIATTGNVTAAIEAFNMPTNWIVKIRVVPLTGTDATPVQATFVSGDQTHSFWQATVSLSNGFSAVQVRAAKP